MDSIEEHDGMIYCVMRSIDPVRPIIQEWWYATDIPAHQMRRSYGEDIVGTKLTFKGGWTFTTPGGSRIAVPTLPGGDARTVEVPIAPPKVRLPVEWRDGQWWKETKRGWVRA